MSAINQSIKESRSIYNKLLTHDYIYSFRICKHDLYNGDYYYTV